MLKYGDILAQTGIRTNAVKGATEAVRITNLAVNPLTATQIGSAEFPFTVIQKNVIAAVGRIVRTYASHKNHPFRANNTSQTSALSPGDAIPSANSAGKSIVGVYGAVRNGTTVLTRQPKQIIESINRSTRKGDDRYYDFVDGYIVHTEPSVTIDVITFDIATELTAMNAASGASPLPDSCLDIAWCAALASMVTDDAYVAQAQACEGYVKNALMEMMQGAVTFNPPPEVSVGG